MWREKVRFELGRCDLIDWEQKVPHLTNAKNGDLYLFPGFILYRAAREAFSLIEYHDVTGNVTDVSFQEEEGVPVDSQVVGKTWAKANKDGSRDRRFTDNYEIPIARYGAIKLTSQNGLWEEFQFSNVQKLLNFASALNSFTASFVCSRRKVKDKTDRSDSYGWLFAASVVATRLMMRWISTTRM